MNNKINRYNSQKKWVENLYFKPVILQAFSILNFKFLIPKYITSHKEEYYWSLYNSQIFRRFVSKRMKYGNQRYYNHKIADKNIDFNQKYVFFALQYFPESSVLPRAGVFWNQLNSIRMLSRVASTYNIKVYVKEHWLEEGRPKRFYDLLKSIKGVTCIPCGVDSFDVVKNSIAVSSATGSIMQEGLIKGKPVITFADHCLCGAPGVFRVHNEIDIKSAFETILDKDFSVNKSETENYFSAMSSTLVKGYLDWPVNPKFSFDECIDDTVNLISRFVNSGMHNDFIYIK